MALKTPDVTKNQMIALATLVIGVLSSMGMPLSQANENRLFAVAVVFPSVLVVADAVIRFGRAVMAGKKYEAQGGYDREDLGLDPEE